MSNSLEPWLVSSYNRYQESVVQNRAAHSVIISGNPNLGTGNLALEIAKLYLCYNHESGEVCHCCKSCMLFDGNTSHPDMVTLLASTVDECGEELDISHEFNDLIENSLGTDTLDRSSNKKAGPRSVRVDGVRRLIEWCSQGSVFGHGKVCIVSNAHLMLESASNALLKTFEEPPEDTLIILLTKSFEDLPATILSRGFKIQVPAVSLEIGLSYLQNKLQGRFEDRRARIALALSQNSPIGAMEVLKENLDEVAFNIVKEISESISFKKSPKQAINLLLSLKDDKKSLILQEFVLELLKYKARVPLNTLPLISDLNLEKLSLISAEHLFNAFNDLRYVKADDNMIPSRAPSSLIYAWVNAFNGE